MLEREMRVPKGNNIPEWREKEREREKSIFSTENEEVSSSLLLLLYIWTRYEHDNEESLRVSFTRRTMCSIAKDVRRG